MTFVLMTLSGILWYDLIAYSLFVTYDICGRVSIGKLGWWVLFLCYILVSRIVIGLLLIGVC